MYSGPKIVKGGLVFGYDNGKAPNSSEESNNSYGLKSRRFFKGESTSNLINGGTDRADGISAPIQSGNHAGCNGIVTNDYYFSATRPHTLRCYSSNNTGYFMLLQEPNTTLNSGTYYTYSFDYKVIKGAPNVFNGSVTVYGNGYKVPDSGSKASNVTVHNKNIGRGWKRYSLTYTPTYTGVNRYRLNLNTGGQLGVGNRDFEVLFDNFQITQSNRPVPYVNGGIIRSHFSALTDLKRNKSIGTNNVTWGSDGLFTFDGTNDYMAIDDVCDDVAGGDFTLEAIIKCSGLDHKSVMSFNQSNGNNRALFMVRTNGMGIYDNSAWHIGTKNVNDNAYHHVVLTYDKSSAACKIYTDTVLNLNSTIATINIDAADKFSVGMEWDGGSPSDFFTGEIPVVKVYNKVLESLEVKRNFKAYKRRFNIT